MATTYPDWAELWAAYYNISPGQLMENVRWGNSTASMGQQADAVLPPGSDIDINTGRRWIDAQMFPDSNPAADLQRTWVEGPNTLSRKGLLSKYLAMLAGGAIAGGAAGAALGGGAGAGSAGAAETMWPGLSQTMPGYASQLGGATGISGTTAGGAGGGFLSGFGDYMALAPTAATAMQGSVPAATTVPSASGSVSGGGMKAPSSVADIWGQIQPYASAAGGVANAVTGGGQSNTGGLLGGLLGAGLGYLDAKSMPDSLTIKNEIDPRLAAYAYGGDGTGGVARSAFDLMNKQLNSPNPLTQAGEKISSMSGTTPDWAALVNQNKGLWDSNPWVTQQQKAITDLTTRNLLENVIPGIGSSANMAGGYGGSRQGIMQGKAISDMNTNLAPALSNLASNAWESSQNRALQGATTAGNYGLANQQQQANLLGVGAGLQNQGAWDPITNMSNVLRGLPGNTSQTQPLFNNPIGNAIGMGSLGSQIGGGINWGDLFKNIGGLFGSGTSTPPPQQNLATYNPYKWG